MNSILRNDKRELPALWGAASILLLVGILLTRSYMMDDAFITLRYSFNLARHGRAIWNQADASHPTLGYTTVLWMALNAVPALFTDNKDLLALGCKLIAVIPLAGLVALLVGRIGRMPVSFEYRLAVVAAIFSQVLYGFHLNSGMETLLFSFLVLCAVCVYAQDAPAPFAYAIGALAFLTRPEGALLVGLMCLWDVRRGRTKQAVAGCLCLLIIAVPVAWVLYAFYGTFLPNAFYVKQQVASSEGLTQTLKFWVTVALPYLPLAIYSVYRLKDNSSRYCCYAALVFSTYFFTVRPLMNTFSRYQWPILVLMTYASLPALQQLGQGIREQRRLAAAVLVALLAVNMRIAVAAHALARSGGSEIRGLVTLGKALARYRDDRRWLAYCGVGAVCYYSDWNTYDTMGLNTRQIAVGAVTPMDVYGYRNTDLVLLNWGDDPDVMNRHDCDALGEQLRKLDYQYAGTMPMVPSDEGKAWGVALYRRSPATANAFPPDVIAAPPTSCSPLPGGDGAASRRRRPPRGGGAPL
jgi:hypothetical protein